MIFIKKIIQVTILLLIAGSLIFGRSQYLKKQEESFQESRKQTVVYFNQQLEKVNEEIRAEIERQANEAKRKQESLSNSRSSSETRPNVQYSYEPGEYLGVFASTSYCIENYHHVCNDGDATTTAMGPPPIPYKTIAVDPKVIPLGTNLVIKDDRGNTYYVQATDTGGAIKGRKIDMVSPTHQEAYAWGRRQVEIWVAE